MKKIIISLITVLALNMGAFAQLNWSGTQTFDGGTQVITQNVTLTGNTTIHVTAGTVAKIQGVISESGGARTLTKTGTGTLYLEQNNTYSGNTNINAGTVYIGGGSTTGNVISNTVTVASGAVLNLYRSNAYTCSNMIAGAGTVTQWGSGHTKLTSNGQNFTGNILVAFGTLEIQKSSSQAYIPLWAATSAVVSAGCTLIYSADAAYQFWTNYPVSGAGNVVFACTGSEIRHNFTHTGTTTAQGTLYIGSRTGTGTVGSISGNINAGSNNIEFRRSNNIFYNGAISGSGNVYKYGAGWLSLGGQNTYSGTTYIEGGGIELDNPTNTISNSYSVNLAANTKLQLFSYSQKINRISSTSTTSELLLGSEMLQIGTNATSDDGSGTFAGKITGTKPSAEPAIRKYGTGTLTLTNTANAFSGKIEIYSGTLGFQALGTLGTTDLRIIGTSGIIWNDGNTADISSRIISIATGTTLSLYIGGNVTFSSSLPTTTANITKHGIGTLTFNASQPYSGTTTINGGALRLRGNFIPNTASVQMPVSTAVLSFQDVSSNIIFNKLIAGLGSVELSNSNVAFSANNTYSGTTNSTGGIVYLGAGGTTGNVAGNIGLNSTTLYINRTNEITIPGIISGNGSVVKQNANKAILTGANIYSGTTSVPSGTLQIGNGTSGSIANTASVEVANNSVLRFEPGSNTTFSKVISGGGNVEYSGASNKTLTFTANNTYTGTTTIAAGYLFLGANTAAGEVIGNIINNGRLYFERNNAVTYSGVISGTGDVYKSLTNTVTLNGINIYSGTTTISAGTLTLGLNGSIEASQQVSISSSGKLNVSAGNKRVKSLSALSASTAEVILGATTFSIGTNATSTDGGGTFTGFFSGTNGSVNKTGTGTFTMNNANNSATGTFAALAGTVELAGKWNGAFSKAAASTLVVNGNVSITGTLAMNGGTTKMDLSAATPSRLTVTGSASSSGTNTLNITGVGTTNSYVVVSAASGVTNYGTFAVTGSAGTLSATATQLTFTKQATFVPVTNIGGIPTTATATLPLTLTGTVVPSNATNQTIIWGVINAGTTGATIAEGSNILNTTGSGQVRIMAVIENGASPTTPFGKNDIYITVSLAALGGTPVIEGMRVFGETLTVYTADLTSTPVIPNLGTLSYQWRRGTTNITDATSPTYTLTQADIGEVINVSVSAANCNGSRLSTNAVIVNKASQNAPASPTMASNTSSSITLNSVAGCVYSKDGGATFQTTTTFSGLLPSTNYNFVQAYAETATHTPSPWSTVATFSTLSAHIPVTNIFNIPTTATATLPLTLSGVVEPSDATNKTIVWSVVSAGTTGASFSGNIFNTTSSGTATVRATITNGLTPTTNYTKDFTITVTKAELIGLVEIVGLPQFGEILTASPYLTSSPTIPNIGVFSYQWKRNGANISGATNYNYTLLQADIGNNISVTVGTSNCTGTVTSWEVEIFKAPQDYPAPPTLASSTSTTITLNTIANGEYSKDGGATFQTSPVFSGLSPSTYYTFYQRHGETATHYQSAWSLQADFTTPGPEFVAVTNITGVPTTATALLPLTLTGTVVPSNATNQAITWSVENQGGTGASITGVTLNTTNSGTVTVKATIANGTAVGTPYTQNFNITVSKATLAGTVSISGYTIFGETLTANTSGLVSSPSVPLGTISYQWYNHNGNPIAGATNSTYTLTAANVGNFVYVVVTVANCNGEIASSNSSTVSKANQAVPPAPTLSSKTSTSITLNTITNGSYMINDNGNWQTSPLFSGLTPSTEYSFKQKYVETATHFESPASAPAYFTTNEPEFVAVTNITGVPTSATATLPLTLTGTVVPSNATNQAIVWSVVNPNTAGGSISGINLNTTTNGVVTVRATITNGLTPTSNYTKDFTITVTKAVLGGSIAILGDYPAFGVTLSTTTSLYLTSTPAIPNLGSLSYQWRRGTTNIPGATSSTYTLVQADIGHQINVQVTTANCTGTVTSDNTQTVGKAGQNPPAPPTLAGSTLTSITLNTIANGEYSKDGGATFQTSPLFSGLTPSTSYNFHQRHGETATHYASLWSAQASFMTPGTEFVAVTNITNVPTEATAYIPLTLTGTVVPSNATNQAMVWSVENAGTTGATISGVNVLNTTNSGTVTVKATINNGTAVGTPYTKTFTITVSKATLGGTVTMGGMPEFGQTLTAYTSELTSSPEVPLGTLSYQWQRGTINISGATNSTYQLVAADVGQTIRVQVTAANCTGTVTSANSAIVMKAPQAAPPAPTLASNTSTSITLNTVSGCEYNINGGAYQFSPVFEGLTPNTEYFFTQRKAETATHLASPISTAASFITNDATGNIYTIVSSVNNTAWGTITPYGEAKVEEGSDITFTITPNENYEIEKVLVNGTSVGAVDTYTFENVQADGTIEVIFKDKVGIEENEFVNVKVYSHQNTVYIKNEDNVALKSVEIYDLNGRKIYQNAITNIETAITLHVANAIYYVRLISQENRTITTKVHVNNSFR